MVASNIVWSPQPGPQKAFVDCPVYEIFYGGARGGGKTDGVLGKMILKAKKYLKRFNAIFVRKNYPDLGDAIARSKDIYGPMGAQFLSSPGHLQWTFPGGGRLRFKHLSCLKDAEEYQGQSFTDVCIEEAGTFEDEKIIKVLHACLRSSTGVPTQMILTGNPGGAGQWWLKKRFIDPCPEGNKILTEEIENLPGLPPIKRQRVFIPATLKDNKLLMQNDPNYVANLRMSGSEALVNAWLFGQWDGNFGTFFSEFDENIHVIEDFPIPQHWKRYTSLDWGYRPDPWVNLWFAVDEYGQDFCYREADGNEDVPSQTAKKLLELSEKDPKFAGKNADPSMEAKKDGLSSLEKLGQGGWWVTKANNDRENGAMRVREYLRINPVTGKPWIRFFKSCFKTIEAMGAMMHDEKEPQKYGEHKLDHWVDPVRYHLMDRPSRSGAPTIVPPENSFELMQARSRNNE